MRSAVVHSIKCTRSPPEQSRAAAREQLLFTQLCYATINRLMNNANDNANDNANANDADTGCTRSAKSWLGAWPTPSYSWAAPLLVL